MKKIRLALLILLILLLLLLLVLGARLVLSVIQGIANTADMSMPVQGEVWTRETEPWALPTIDPGELSDQFYDGPEPEAPYPPLDQSEELVTVPVLETAEQLAEELK